MVILTCSKTHFVQIPFRPLHSIWTSGLPAWVSASRILSFERIALRRGTWIHPRAVRPRSLLDPGLKHRLSPPFLKTKDPITHTSQKNNFVLQIAPWKLFLPRSVQVQYPDRIKLVMESSCLVTGRQ
jgi:hypothetical protein